MAQKIFKKNFIEPNNCSTCPGFVVQLRHTIKKIVVKQARFLKFTNWILT